MNNSYGSMKFQGYVEFQVDEKTYEAYIVAYGVTDRFGCEITDIDKLYFGGEFYCTTADETDNTDYVQKYESNEEFKSKVFSAIKDVILNEKFDSKKWFQI